MRNLLTSDSFVADLHLDFFDHNQVSQGRKQALTSLVVPLAFLEPFKPVHLDLELPISLEHLEDDLNIDAKLGFDATKIHDPQVFETFKKREARKKFL